MGIESVWVYWYCNILYCILDINECDNNFCENGGFCINIEGFYICLCFVGWLGL